MEKPCHPDHSAEIKRLKRIQGQLEGIERMILDVESNRLSKDELIRNLKAIKVKTEYLLNLVNLES